MSEDSSAEGRGCLLRVCPEKSFGTSSGSLLRPGKPFLSPLSPLASQSFAWENGTVLSTESYRKHGASRGSRLRYPDRFEFEMRKREREEAQRLYKKKKMEAFKVLSKKTRKGQPNLNLQMEYLLQKIQETS
ncbi:coiled-coil domain containing 59 [Cricetulus griseus]